MDKIVIQEYFLLKQGSDTKWKQVSMSYESESLIETAKKLTKNHPHMSFSVTNERGLTLWPVKSTLQQDASFEQ